MVSVVMPAYNAEKYIKKAIDSILVQTYQDFELLIIEDCSTDRTLEMIESCQDSRIRLFKNEVNRGIAYSTNVGLRESRGEYIALLDDDDMAVCERLEIQKTYLDAHPDIDVLGGRSVTIDEKDTYLWIENEPRKNPRYIEALLLFKRVDFRNGTTMIRKSFIEKHGLCYQEACFGMQDYQFFIASSKVGNISSVGKILLLSRVHEENHTAVEKAKRGTQRAEKYFELQKESLKASGYQLQDTSMRLIGKLFSEEGALCADYKEYRKLVKVLEELMKQAKEMNVSYQRELEHLCKTILADQAVRMQNFEIGMFLGNEAGV